MEEIITTLEKKLHTNLSVYRDYYTHLNKDKDQSLNTFYLNASFIYAISDFEKNLALFLDEIIKSDDYYNERFKKLISMTKPANSTKENHTLNDLILYSRNRVITITHLILNDKFALDSISFDMQFKKFKFEKYENIWSYTNPSKMDELEKKRIPRNTPKESDKNFMRMISFFDEAYERRNALVHRSTIADDTYLKRSKLKNKKAYDNISIHDQVKKYYINNKFFTYFELSHSMSFPKDEAYKEDLSDTDLLVNGNYYSHVVMQIELFIYYFVDLWASKNNASLIESYLFSILSNCINFNHNVKEAETKFIFENCIILINKFFASTNLSLIENNFLFSYALLILDHYDKVSQNTNCYQEFMDIYDIDILKNPYAAFYDALKRNDRTEMNKMLVKMHEKGLLKDIENIKENLMFTVAVKNMEFRKFCDKYLGESINIDDFENKFSQQYMY